MVAWIKAFKTALILIGGVITLLICLGMVNSLLLRNNEAFIQLRQQVIDDRKVKKVLGNSKGIQPSLFMAGHFKTSNNENLVYFRLKVLGEKGEGKVYVKGQKVNSHWVLTRINVVLN